MFLSPSTHSASYAYSGDTPPPLTYLHLGLQISPHTTSQRKNGPKYHFNLVLLSVAALSAPHHEPPPPPNCFNQAKQFDDGRTPALPLSISSNNIEAALAKYE